MLVDKISCLYLHPLTTKVEGEQAPKFFRISCKNNAGVVELVDTLDLGSSAARCESSSLSARTNEKLLLIEELFFDLRQIVFGRRDEKVFYYYFASHSLS